MALGVTIGLAPLRRSHVRLCHTSKRDLGALFVSLNALTGHRSQPRRLYRPACHADTGRGAGFRRLSGGWTIASSGDWGSGNPAIHRIARVPQHVVPYAWTRPLIYCHAAVPVFPFGSRLGIRPRNDPPSSSLLNREYDRAPRGASCYCSLHFSDLGLGSYSASVEATKTNISLRKFTCHNRTYHPGGRSTLGWQVTGWCASQLRTHEASPLRLNSYWLAIRSRDNSSHLCPLSGRYDNCASRRSPAKGR